MQSVRSSVILLKTMYVKNMIFSQQTNNELFLKIIYLQEDRYIHIDTVIRYNTIVYS